MAGELTNTVSDGDEWYGIAIVDASIIGGEDYPTIDDLILDLLPYNQDDIQYNLLYNYARYVAYYGPELVISALMDDVIKRETGSIDGFEYGKYIAVAYGIEDDTYNLTGNYATLEFESVDPHVVADYSDFIGTWTVNNASEWTVAAKVEGESYTVSGMLGSLKVDVEATYENGYMSFYEQELDPALTMSTSYGTAENITLSGSFSQGSSTYYGYGRLNDVKSIIFKIGEFQDGTFDISGGQCPVSYQDGSEGYIPFTHYGLWGKLGEDAGNYAGYNINLNSYRYAIPSSFAAPVEDPTVYVFKENFEEENCLDTWTLIDADGDGYEWYLSTVTHPHSGSTTLSSASYASGALNPDNWAFTPAISFTSNNYISYWVEPQDKSYPSEHYAVYITDKEPSEEILDSLEPIEEVTLDASDMTQHILQVPAEFQNKTGYIAFRHFDCSDWFRINVDDLAVSEGQPATASVASVSSIAPKSIAVAKTANVNLSEKTARSMEACELAPLAPAKSSLKEIKKAKGVVNEIIADNRK